MRQALATAWLVALWGCGSSSRVPPDGHVSVVNFNLLHGVINEDAAAEPYDRLPERLPRVAAVLAEHRPAIIILQEAYFGWLTGYPDVRRILKAKLDAPGDEYQSVFASYLGGGVMVNGGAGIGQVTLTRWPILAAHRASLGGLRIVVHVRVDSGREPIDTYNVHLEGSRKEPEQAEEIDAVLDFVKRTAAPEGSVLISGDLNSYENEVASAHLKAAGFIDLGAAAGLKCDDTDKGGCTNSNLPLGEPGQRSSHRIDYLWLRSSTRTPGTTAPIFDTPFELGDGKVLWASDHIGIAAEF